MTLGQEEYKPRNQLLLFLQNVFRDFVCEILTYSCLTIHYMIILVKMPYFFFIYTLGHLYMIISFIIDDIWKLFYFLKLNFEILSNVIQFLKSSLLDSKVVTNEYWHKNMDVYRKMKTLLNHFHILPLSPREGIIGMLYLNKMPKFIWDFVLPFPKFLFEDTFKNISIREGEIMVTLPSTMPLPTIVIKHEDDDNSTNCIIFNGEDNLLSSGNSSNLETDKVPVISSDSKEKIQ